MLPKKSSAINNSDTSELDNKKTKPHPQFADYLIIIKALKQAEICKGKNNFKQKSSNTHVLLLDSYYVCFD